VKPRYEAFNFEVGSCLDPAATTPLGPALLDVSADVELAFVVGPEGGLSAAEIDSTSTFG
jgi:16S rRNA U1498 N3-methylase RsmE